MLSQPGPIRRRLSISDSSSDWLVPKTVLKVMPASPAGNAGWVAGYFTCKNTGWGEVKARVEDKFYTSPAQPSSMACIQRWQTGSLPSAALSMWARTLSTHCLPERTAGLSKAYSRWTGLIAIWVMR